MTIAIDLLHERERQRVSLLAAGALAGAEAAAEIEAAHRHLAGCAQCRADHESLRAMLRAMPAVEPEAQPLAPLVADVRTRIAAQQAPAATARLPWRAILVPLAAAAALAAWLVLPPLVRRVHDPGLAVTAVPARQQQRQIVLSPDSMERLERNLSREHAARYLSEAQDLLVSVAETLPRCTRKGHVDVGDEAARSRALLSSRAFLVDDSEALASVRPVLDDVDNVLREVAALEACARRSQIDSISAALTSRRLLMKIDLMARELAS
jgi:anti-sigma-K factor RskA